MRDGFIQAEYFEFAGGEYISTEFKPNSNTKIVVDCQMVELASSTGAVCGSRKDYSAMIWICTDKPANNWCGLWNGTEYKISASTQSFTDRHVISLDKSQFKVDSTSVAINDSTSFTNSYSMHIGDVNNANSPQYPCKVRIFSMQVYDNGTLVRDFIPCYENNGYGHIGLYDRTRDVFHRANGSQTSTLAINNPIVGRININGAYKTINNGYVNINGSYKPISQAYMFKDEEYTKLDYIQSNGNQYINTEVSGDSDIKIVTEFEVTKINSSGTTFVFGSQGTDSVRYTLGITSSGSFRSDYGSEMTPGPAVTLNKKYTITKDKNVCTIDGTAVTSTAKTFTGTTNIYLFGRSYSSLSCSSIRMYSCKIYKNNVLVRDFIPVKRNSDNMIGLFESCENKFYCSDMSANDKIPYANRSCIETTYANSDHNTNAKWVKNNTTNYAANAKVFMAPDGELNGVAEILEAHDASDANKFAKYNYDYGYSEPYKNLKSSDCTLVSIKVTNSSGTEISSSYPVMFVDDNHRMHFSITSTALASAAAGNYTLTITVSRSSVSCRFDIPITKINTASRYFTAGSNSSSISKNSLVKMYDIRTITCKSFTAELLVPTWTITTKVSGASYGFSKTSDGYYTSSNAGVANSASVCRVNFTNNTGAAYTVTFNCINYAESRYDYGIIGKINTALSTSNTADTTYTKSFSGSQSSSVQTVKLSVPTGTSWVDVKYRKDGSINSNNDSLKFKITT